MLKQVFIVATISLLILQAAAQPPKNAVALYKKGIAFKEKGMYPDAVKSFWAATLIYKKYDSAFLQIGESFYRMSNFDTAVIFYKKALEVNPKQVKAYIGIGNIYRDAKPDYDQAIINFKNAANIDNKNKETFYSIAWCYNSKKEYDSAITYAVKSLEIDNNYKPGYNELGHAYRGSKKYKEAIEQFQKNLAISVNELPLYYSGMCYLELQDKEGAMKMYDELKKLGSSMAEGLKRRMEAPKN